MTPALLAEYVFRVGVAVVICLAAALWVWSYFHDN